MYEDDMILPDDFEADLPQSEEVSESLETETPVEPVEDITPTEQQTEQEKQEALQALRVKYNHEEREIPIDEAIPLVQKGLNYDKLQERYQALESDPRLQFIESLANQYGMDVNEYMTAVQQQQEQSRIQELVEKGISEELAQEMLENRKFREQIEAEKQAKQQEEQENAQYNEFFDYFREANGRDFAPNQDNIPENVWEATKNGVPLKYAYMEHQNQQLQQQLQTLKQNESNAKKAPIGSVTAHGGTETASEDDFLRGFFS